MVHAPGLDLYLFGTDPDAARRALAAGIAAAVVDWEWRGKQERQAGADTEINRDSVKDLYELSPLVGLGRCCRINRFGEWTRGEIDDAVANGAGEILLPMVESPGEVERFLALVDGRARAGILVETISACEGARELARLPLYSVYLGLHDLALQRRDPWLFRALADGTAERVREAFAGVRFGVAGLTRLDAGAPIPCRLLLGEMARLECAFAFLRRSFKRDIAGRDLPAEVARLQAAWRRLRRRAPPEVARDRALLVRAIAQHSPRAAPMR